MAASGEKPSSLTPTLPPAAPEPSLDLGSQYRVLERIGRGGMGEVYRAEQREPVRREVAIKLIRPGLDSRDVLARFESERQALAWMSHPNIAAVHDAGVAADGRPYFVMEFVRGTSLNEFCNTERLSLRERLNLFLKVCDAIQHAHSKGIFHRDIKPGNILVSTNGTQAIPKVIDFGLAKATSGRLSEQTLYTELGQVLGTLEYMSPEQAEGTRDIDARTDVYSLGVVLYKLLTDSLPFDSHTLRRVGIAEFQRIIREVEPPRPSTRVLPSRATSETPTVPAATEAAPLDSSRIAHHRRMEPHTLVRHIRGELDWITMKCLEKSRSRRYQTPNELAADITRYLNGEPVLAGPPSRTYRLRKFVVRNRAIAGGSAIAALATLAGIAGLTAGYFRALHEQQRADAAREFASSILRSPIPSQGNERDIKVVDILDQAAARLRATKPSDPELAADSASLLTEAYEALGSISEACEFAAIALQETIKAHGSHSPEAAKSSADLAAILVQLDRSGEAGQLVDGALVTLRKHGRLHPTDLAQALVVKGEVVERSNAEAGEPYFREALELLNSNHQENAIQALGAWAGIAGRHYARKEWPQAIAAFERAAEIAKLCEGPFSKNRLLILGNLASSRAAAGDNSGAAREYDSLIAEARASLGLDHPTLADIEQFAGAVYYSVNNAAAAEAALRDAERILRKLPNIDPRRVAELQRCLATYLIAWHRPADALPEAQAAFETFYRLDGIDRWETQNSLNHYFEALRIVDPQRALTLEPTLREWVIAARTTRKRSAIMDELYHFGLAKLILILQTRGVDSGEIETLRQEQAKTGP